MNSPYIQVHDEAWSSWEATDVPLIYIDVLLVVSFSCLLFMVG